MHKHSVPRDPNDLFQLVHGCEPKNITTILVTVFDREHEGQLRAAVDALIQRIANLLAADQLDRAFSMGHYIDTALRRRSPNGEPLQILCYQLVGIARLCSAALHNRLSDDARTYIQGNTLAIAVLEFLMQRSHRQVDIYAFLCDINNAITPHQCKKILEKLQSFGLIRQPRARAKYDISFPGRQVLHLLHVQ